MLISLQDVQQARENLEDVIHRTPVLTSTQLSELCGNNIFLKAEHLQKTGAFKIRGATNKVKQVVQDGAKFVTAASSGNHGQAVSYIATKLGIPATIVVPKDANPSKVAAIKAYGGKVETCGFTSEERIPRAKALAEQENGVFVPPYDDPFVIAGQGTIGLEILEQVAQADIVVVPIGGGGLISGILTAIKETNPSVKVIGVEPESANDTYISLQKGEITAIQKTTTIADGLRTLQPGGLTFPIVQKYIDGIVLVNEAEMKQAMRIVFERMKQLIEPSSAVTVAAAMSRKINVTNKNIACVISGGNVDLNQLSMLLH